MPPSTGWTPRSSTCSARASAWVVPFDATDFWARTEPDNRCAPGRSRRKSPAPRTCLGAAAFATSLSRTLTFHPSPIARSRLSVWSRIFPRTTTRLLSTPSAAAGHRSPGDRHASPPGPDAALAAARLREITTAIDPGLRIERLQSLGEDLPPAGIRGLHTERHAWLRHADRRVFRDGGDVHPSWRSSSRNGGVRSVLRCALGASPAPAGGGDLRTLAAAASPRSARASGVVLAILLDAVDPGGGRRRPQHPRHCSGRLPRS